VIDLLVSGSKVNVIWGAIHNVGHSYDTTSVVVIVTIQPFHKIIRKNWAYCTYDSINKAI